LNFVADSTSPISNMALASAAPPGFDPEKADNFEDVCPRPFRIYTRLTSMQMEKQFAVKAVQHMMTYWSILEKMPGSKLRLTRMDDDILAHLHADFPEFDPAATIDEDEMKSPANKERWRKFMMVYEKGEKKVENFNFGTMLRRSPKTEYGEKETMFALRMQFYAVEIARNRAGLNDWIYEQAQEAVDKEKEKEKNQS
jgi:Polysaccharide biosynthesis